MDGTLLETAQGNFDYVKKDAILLLHVIIYVDSL